MKFEYNGNLEESKRVLLVANEIKLAYPEIEMKDAKIIASLEEPITTMKTSEMEFKRLYSECTSKWINRFFDIWTPLYYQYCINIILK